MVVYVCAFVAIPPAPETPAQWQSKPVLTQLRAMFEQRPIWNLAALVQEMVRKHDAAQADATPDVWQFPLKDVKAYATANEPPRISALLQLSQLTAI